MKNVIITILILLGAVVTKGASYNKELEQPVIIDYTKPNLENICDGEMDLLYRTVYAEAGSEPFKGQVAVAQVILNRVNDERFPSTITGVIHQEHQFESVSNGMLYDRTPTQKTKNAVHEALKGTDVVGDCIGFWATYLDKSNYLWDLEIEHTIGNHVFTSEY